MNLFHAGGCPAATTSVPQLGDHPLAVVTHLTALNYTAARESNEHAALTEVFLMNIKKKTRNRRKKKKKLG